MLKATISMKDSFSLKPSYTYLIWAVSVLPRRLFNVSNTYVDNKNYFTVYSVKKRNPLTEQAINFVLLFRYFDF